MIICSILIGSFFAGCSSNRWRKVQISSPDDKNHITIITLGDERYIINGKHENVPKSNYALVDISKVDRLGDEIGICWNQNGYQWELHSLYSELIESDLDTAKFKVYEELDKDDKGIPSSEKYLNRGCALVYLREKLIRPENGAVVIFK